MVEILPYQLKNGRGAVSKPAGRFERFETQPIDDGWSKLPAPIVNTAQFKISADTAAPEKFADDFSDVWPNEGKIKTNLHIDTSRRVINEIKSPDLPYMRSINPYRGCEHGCIYCFARPSHSYLGYSAGLDFETEIFYKPDAPEVLKRELAAKNYEPKPITLGSNTDCFQPVERELKLTRRIIEVLAEHNHPLTIITKSALVTRDIDLLAPMAAKGLARVNVSLTTLDPYLANVMEPRASAPYRRLATIKALSQAGIPVNVMVAPIIPALTDMEMEKIMEAARDAGATSAAYTVVRLPYELKDLFREWLQTHRPDRAEHVLSLIRQMRGGKLYDATYGQRRTGKGIYADLIANRFDLAEKRLGLDNDRGGLRCDLFQAPERAGQLVLRFT